MKMLFTCLIFFVCVNVMMLLQAPSDLMQPSQDMPNACGGVCICIYGILCEIVIILHEHGLQVIVIWTKKCNRQ